MGDEWVKGATLAVSLLVLAVQLGRSFGWFERGESTTKETVAKLASKESVAALARELQDLCAELETAKKDLNGKWQQDHDRLRELNDKVSGWLAEMKTVDAVHGEKLHTLEREMKEVRTKFLAGGGLALS